MIQVKTSRLRTVDVHSTHSPVQSSEFTVWTAMLPSLFSLSLVAHKASLTDIHM